jgi:hypothetical protein
LVLPFSQALERARKLKAEAEDNAGKMARRGEKPPARSVRRFM